MERLQKAIAQSGYCSRRRAEELILAGKVKVNGKVVSTLGTKVSSTDEIVISGKQLNKEEKEYYLFYKPKGCVSTVKDEHDRVCIADFFPGNTRLYPVGRLDYDTSGALLVTNDGAFANLLTHPRYHVPKTYTVNLDGILTEEDVKALRRGLKTEEERFLPAKVFVKERDYTRGRTQLELTITEGKNHQVKNMMAALGHKVRRLHRKSFAGLSADTMRPGEFRRLKAIEIRELKQQAEKGKEA